MIHLGFTSGNTDYPASLDLTDLAHCRAHRTGSRGHNQAVSGRRPAYFEEPEVGGHTGHAQNTERGGDWGKIGIHLANATPIRDRVQLPSEVAYHRFTIFKVGMFGVDDLSHDTADHHLPKAYRGGIRRALVHASPLIGIEGEIESLYEKLPVSGAWDGTLH